MIASFGVRARLGPVTAAVAVAALSSCGSTPPPLTAPPAAETHAELVGALCSGGHCQCRDRQLVGAPPEGKKRYHIRLGPAAQPLWLTVGQSVLYKDEQRGDSCYVIDLAPGKYPVQLRARAATGVAVGVAIEELGVDPN